MDPLQEAYTEILTEIGEDLERDGLRDTPTRAAKAMQFLTRGYQESLKPWSMAPYSNPIAKTW